MYKMQSSLTPEPRLPGDSSHGPLPRISLHFLTHSLAPAAPPLHLLGPSTLFPGPISQRFIRSPAPPARLSWPSKCEASQPR